MTLIQEAKKEVDKKFTQEELIVFYETYFSSLLLKSMKKYELVEHFVKTFTDKERFKKFVSGLKPSVKDILYQVVWFGSISAADINMSTGKKSAGMEYGKFRILDPDFSMFIVYSYLEFKIGFCDSLREVMKTYMKKPDGYDLVFTEDIGLTGFEYKDDDSILADIEEYFAFYSKILPMEINYKYSSKIIPKKILRKLEKEIVTKEFFPEDKSMMSIKKNLIVNFFLNFGENVFDDPKDFIKSSIHNFLKKPNGAFELVNLLPHLKITYSENILDSAKNNFVKVMKNDFKVDKWISIDNLFNFLSLRDIDLFLFGRDLYNYNNYVYYNTAEFYKSSFSSQISTYTEKNFLRDSGMLIHFVYKPYVKGIVFLFASLGILDIKYNYPISLDENMKDLFCFEGLKYVKLTPFGEYILDLREEYSYSIKDDTEVKLFDNALMIKVEGKSPKKHKLLENLAIKISDTLYKTDAKTFYASCTSSREVLRLMEKFKDIVTGDIPENWISFFVSLKENINPFKEVKEVLKLKLPVNDKKLHEIVLRDNILKKIILKAEDYNIIVAERDYNKLMNRLKNYGYFCDKL